MCCIFAGVLLRIQATHDITKRQSICTQVHLSTSHFDWPTPEYTYLHRCQPRIADLHFPTQIPLPHNQQPQTSTVLPTPTHPHPNQPPPPKSPDNPKSNPQLRPLNPHSTPPTPAPKPPPTDPRIKTSHKSSRYIPPSHSPNPNTNSLGITTAITARVEPVPAPAARS